MMISELYSQNKWEEIPESDKGRISYLVKQAQDLQLAGKNPDEATGILLSAINQHEYPDDVQLVKFIVISVYQLSGSDNLAPTATKSNPALFLAIAAVAVIYFGNK